MCKMWSWDVHQCALNQIMLAWLASSCMWCPRPLRHHGTADDALLTAWHAVQEAKELWAYWEEYFSDGDRCIHGDQRCWTKK